MARLGPVLDVIEDAVEPLFVAGLAHPDPELPERLAMVADLAARYGLATAVERVLRLADAFTTEDPGAAWEAAQHLVLWLRLFRREQGLLVAEASLMDATTPASGSRVPTETLRFWPDGFELIGQHLRLRGRNIVTGQPVVVHDEISELNPDDPFARPVLSRLLQASLPLERIVNSVLDFENHPVTKTRLGSRFAPAFRAVPAVLAVADALPLPMAGPIDLVRVRYPVRVSLRVVITRDALSWTRDGSPCPIQETTPLRQAMIRRALTERADMPIEATVVGDGTSVRLLATHDVDGRHFPSVDPRCERLGRAQIYSWTLDGDRWLQTVAAHFGGATFEALEALSAAWSEADGPQSDRARHRLGLPCRAPTPLNIEPTTLDPAQIFEGLWHHWIAEEPLDDGLLGRLVERLTVPDPTPTEVCARAVALAFWGDILADTEDAEPDDLNTEQTEARTFFAAHLADWREDVLPDLGELLRVADTAVILEGGSLAGPTLAALGFPRSAMAHLVSEALRRWRLASDPQDAANALALIPRAGLTDWFFD